MGAPHTRRLSEYAQALFDDLARDGVTPTPEECVRLNALCHAAESPEHRMALSRGVPACAGQAVLWPLTLNAADWYSRIGQRVRGGPASITPLAYAMAHGREDLPESVRDAERAIKAWSRSLKCRHRELVEAVSQVISQDDDMDVGESLPESDRGSMGNLSAMLAAMTHTAPEVWERHVSIPYCLAVIRAVVAQNAAEGRSSKHDPRIKFERAIMILLKRIRERHHGK
jgi:hypothetical protein